LQFHPKLQTEYYSIKFINFYVKYVSKSFKILQNVSLGGGISSVNLKWSDVFISLILLYLLCLLMG